MDEGSQLLEMKHPEERFKSHTNNIIATKIK